jgi:[protein-PII] uridylyltransferase
MFPDAHVLETMAAGGDSVRVTDGAVTVVSPDRPGTFSRVSGVLALHSLEVVGAQAHSDEQGMAASRFRVLIPEHGPIEWTPIVDDLHRALRGELAIEARLAERATHYRPKRRTSAVMTHPQVVFIDGASSNATVIEVRTPDRHGVLHAITRAFAELGLDIRHATVQTLGDEVIDSFYVRTMDKRTVDDPDHRREIERAVLFTLDADMKRVVS